MSPEFKALIDYRGALAGWYGRMFSAAEDGREFSEPRPDPADFLERLDRTDYDVPRHPRARARVSPGGAL